MRVIHGGAALVVDLGRPASDGALLLPWRAPLAATAGSEDMKVSASLAAPSDFYVEAVDGYDTYVVALSFEIADASAVLNKFGNITALTNGCVLEWTAGGGLAQTLHPALKSNFDFVRLCLGMPSFGDGNGAFRANNVSSTSEGFIPVLDVRKTYGMPWGLRLRKGSKDRVTLRVRDNTTGVDSFGCVATGFRVA